MSEVQVWATVKPFGLAALPIPTNAIQRPQCDLMTPCVSFQPCPQPGLLNKGSPCKEGKCRLQEIVQLSLTQLLRYHPGVEQICQDSLSCWSQLESYGSGRPYQDTWWRRGGMTAQNSAFSCSALPDTDTLALNI